MGTIVTIVIIIVVISAVSLLAFVLHLFTNADLYWCKAFHKSHHTLKQIEYGSTYAVECSKCGKVYVEKRE